MNAAFKAKWVEPLRSGEYEQARNTIRRDNALCCIGVGYVACHGEWPSDRLFTAQAADALGISTSQRDKLVILNDDDRRSFAEIATYIENNL